MSMLEEFGSEPAEEPGMSKATQEAILTELIRLNAKVDVGFSSIRGEISDIRAEMTAEFASVRGELGSFRREMTAEFASVRSEIGDVRSEVAAVRKDTQIIRKQTVHLTERVTALESGSAPPTPTGHA